MIKITFDAKKLSRELRQIMPTVPELKTALKQASAVYLQTQRQLTKQGLDAGGRQFMAYSPPYKDKKRRAGRKTQPDLKISGDMLRNQKVSMKTSGRGAAAVVEFDGTRPGSCFKDAASAKHTTGYEGPDAGGSYSRGGDYGAGNMRGGGSYSRDPGGSRGPTKTESKAATRGGLGKMVMGRTNKVVSNAVLAGANDRTRPFIGMSQKTAGKVIGFFLATLKKLIGRRQKIA